MSSASVLFVCLGNICRSPLAEGIFRAMVNDAGLSDDISVDSCGTSGYHEGEPPHRDSIRVARDNGVLLQGQASRPLRVKDFDVFSHIVALDRQNRKDILALRSDSEAEIFCLREFDPKRDSMDVPDPYWGGPEGFEVVYEIIERCCKKLLEDIESELR